MGVLLGCLVAQSIGGLACWRVEGLSICGQSVACGSVACEVGGLLPWLGGPWLPLVGWAGVLQNIRLGR